MKSNSEIIKSIASKGFAIVGSIFNNIEIEEMVSSISSFGNENLLTPQSKDLFAIRKFFQVVPCIREKVFNKNLFDLITDLFGADYFLVKSIYFDKPQLSNWFVSYHQDITISVNQKIEMDGFKNWTVKHNQFSVQPPVELLEKNFTIRIHLDDTDEDNGALKVIPVSHLKGIVRFENLEKEQQTDHFCKVKKGGVMIMKPLLFHASNRTTNDKKRRVIHLEFSNKQLPAPLEWAEFESMGLVSNYF